MEWSLLGHKTKMHPPLLGNNGHISGREQTIPMVMKVECSWTAAVVKAETFEGSFIHNGSGN